MRKIKELKSSDLTFKLNASQFNFKTTDDISGYNGIIGQRRALQTVETALEMPQKGFNLYVCGQVGMGKMPYVLSIVNRLAKTKPVPNDLCYIHNFENPNEPIAIFLKAGDGRTFKEDMSRFISTVRKDLLKIFASENYEKEKKIITKQYETKKNEIMRAFDKHTSAQGFKIRTATDGIYFSPMHNGKVLNEKEFNALDEKTKEEFKAKSPKIQQETHEIMQKLEILEKECAAKVQSWQANMVTYVVSKNINDLKIRYKGDLKIQNFLYSVQEDVVKNAEKFKDMADNMQNIPPQMRASAKPWEKYKVNLIVNNENLDHAPVVVCSNPTYYDLFGKLEYENYMGSVKTDHTMLKAGVFYKANGGYLLVNARDLLTNMTVWEAFKRVIRNSELTIDSSRDMTTPVTMIGIKPESVPIDCQVVLFGSEAIYQQLSNLDSDFKKLFKMKADFDDSIDKDTDTVRRTIEYVAYVVKKENLLPFKSDAVKAIIEYSSRCAGDKTKLTAMQTDVTDIIIESAHIAKTAEKKSVEAMDVITAAEDKKRRYGKYNDGIMKMIEEGSVMISTSGADIGRINGLTILNTGDASFGKPVRITANTYMGGKGIVNIEREVSMSGTTHSKGVFILSAYIGEKFAQEFPLCFNASICFEQLYNGVDGDSASSTELYAILSSLSGVPIKQGIAVTGSVNQKGEIQPIGGVSDKIEGFYEVCKMQGLTGEQGVIIPYQNVKNLMLKHEIVEAVDKGMFHIYPVSHIEEGIEILTGVKYGTYKEETGFEKDTICAKVYNKLKKYSEYAK